MSKAKIFYFTLQDEQTKDEKLDWFERARFEQIPFDHITPDQKANWINLTDNDFDSFLPLIDKEVKAGKSQKAVFQLFSSGVQTKRDEWAYDFSRNTLIQKMQYLIDTYQERLTQGEVRELDIKWDHDLVNYLKRKIQKNFQENQIVKSLYRPYAKQYLYFDRHFNSRTFQLFNIFPISSPKNNLIWVKTGSEVPFYCLITDCIPDLLPQGASQCLPLYRYNENGNRIDNITDWALEQFRERYLPSPPQPSSPAGEEGAGTELNFPSPAGEEGAGLNLSSPTREGQGERVNELTYLSGARRNIPEKLLLKAKELRQKQTPAEEILWECLRANRLCDAKFRRQHNIGQYIADFYCHAAKLVIELDGEVHETQSDRDVDRDAWMQSNGLTILRFKNTKVIQDLEQVLQTIICNLPPLSKSLFPGGEEGAESDLPSPAGEGSGVRAITKLDIFHYTYAVLHHPAYRTKYELNLKREFPRLPFYADFHQWATWGKTLMDLHLNYETIEPYGLRRVDVPSSPNPFSHRRRGAETPEIPGLEPPLPMGEGAGGEGKPPKAKLKADKIEGKIILDTVTTLEGVPAVAWDYKLGNRSALEWILDQYKEKKPKDPTIAKLFNTYQFADYKEQVIDLLDRVCTVSVRTIEIIQQMPDTVEHQSSN
jgi:very-short-patch-repair endonuclease